MILAIDLGTKTGWAIANNGKITAFGAENFSPKQKKPPPHKGERFLKFGAWLDGVIKSNGVTVIYYEKVRRHLGTDAAHMYGAFEGVMFMVSKQNNIDCCPVSVGTIKKSATGKGNAGKLEVINAANILGYNTQDDNAADAIGLANLAIKMEESHGKNTLQRPQKTTKTNKGGGQSTLAGGAATKGKRIQKKTI